MLIFVSTIHVLLCVFMIFVILLQPGKDAGMGSALGGGAATSAFGGRGAVTFLSKVTAVCAIAFFVTSLGLSFESMRGGLNVEDLAAKEAAKTAPAAPSTEAPKEGAAVEEKAPEAKVPAPPEKAVQGNEAVPANKAPPAK